MRIIKSQRARLVKRNRIFNLAKGFYGKRKNCYTIAVRAVHKSLLNAGVGRRLKKRMMRQLWINRIGFASMEHNVPYDLFVTEMARHDILINRKVLADLAIHEPRTFRSLAEIAKSRCNDGLLAALD